MSGNEERQESELLALTAIYPELIDLRNEQKNDLKTERKTTHRKNRQPTWRPLEFEITLKPNSENVYVQLDLYVKCNNKYPKEQPELIQIKNSVGLSNVLIQQILNDLIELTKELAGKDEESLFMMINKVEDFLNENNKPAPKSFYDQMLSNKLKQQKEEERLKLEIITKEKEIEKQKEEELNKALKEAMVEKQKLMESENKMRRASFMEDDEITSLINSLEISISNLKEQFLSNLSLKNSELNNQKSLRVCSIEHPLVDCKFNLVNGNELHVQRCKCEFHFDTNHSDYLAIQIKKDLTSFYSLSEWNMKLNQKLDKNQSKEEKSRIMKELAMIRSKVEHHLVYLNHPHIVQPIAITYSLDNDLIILRLLQNYLTNIRFCDIPFITNQVQQEIKSTSYYFIQILDALNYLHSNKLIHGNLNTENVIIDLNTGQIKLINIFIHSYINDFIDRSHQIQFSPTKSASSPIETVIGFKLKDIGIDYNRFAYLLSWFLLEFKFNFKQLLSIKQTDLIKMLHEQKNLDDCTLELIKSCLNRNSFTALEPLVVEFFTSRLEKLNKDLNDDLNKNKTVQVVDELESDQLMKKDNFNLLTGKNSRLSDFVILSKLGKGGFGEVYKVKNILDQNEYALKKIIINTTNKLLNKKIKEEVRYLSGLCHENVVRYFSSWIEYEMGNKDDDEGTDEDELDSFSSKRLEKDSLYDSDDLTDDEVDARCLFSNSLCLPTQVNKADDSSDFIVFQDSQAGDKADDIDQNDEKSNSALTENKLKKKTSSINPSPFNEVMYIQMELCEKSTLQHAINEKLYQDNRRSRRLFREIIEALSYIHQKFIIHRDLKPGNIFLDSFDHVKIGDFGLATGYVNEYLHQQQHIQSTSNQENVLVPTNHNLSLNAKSEGVVGTPFYLAPEIQAKSQDLSTKKITYTSKVDIYSSGIIFFEMCYATPTTGMERFKILTNLRLPEIVLPNDVANYFSEQEICLIKSLLNHNAKERPSSSELLESEYLPPLEIEEAKQQVMLKQIIQNTRSKQHKYLLNTLFNRQMNSVEDIVYDSEIEILKSKKLINNEQLRARVFQFVCDRLKLILKKYGGQNLNTPTFTPKNSLSKFNLNHAFCIMDNNGCIIQAPYDLRIPFARFIARTQNLNTPTFRRYAIDKVYRSRLIGYHPKELYECAFDIVTTQSGVNWPILPDVEVFSVLNDIIDSFDSLKNRPFTLRINSIKFLKAVFAYFEIDEKHHDHVLRIIAESNDRNYVSKNNDLEYSKTSKDYVNYMLASHNILETNKINILTQMLMDNEKNNAKELLELIHFYMRRKPQLEQKKAYENAVDAIKELGLIIDCLQNSCKTFRMKIKFVPNLVLNLSNCNIYSKLIFQLQYDVVKKHQVLHQILATGGRYDDLIENFSVNFSSKTDPINEKALIFAEKKAAVGFSLEIEKIIKCVIEDEEQNDFQETSDCDIVLYAEIYDDERFRVMFKDLCQIANELRQQNLRVKIFNEKSIKSLSDLNKYCIDNLIKYLCILIKSNDEKTKNLYQLKTLTYEKEKSFDRRPNNLMDCYEVIKYIKNELISNRETNYSSSPFGLNSPFNLNQLNSNLISFESCSINYSSSLSSNSSINFTSNSSNASNLKYQSTPDLISKIASSTNIQFINVEKTFEQLSKKKVQSLIISLISNKFNFYSKNSKIEVLASEIPFKVLKLVVYESEFEKDAFGNLPDSQCEQNIKRCVEKWPKYRNQINEIICSIFELKRRRDYSPLIILLSTNDVHDFKFVFVS